jgi:hypothetical protein
MGEDHLLQGAIVFLRGQEKLRREQAAASLRPPPGGDDSRLT